MLIEWYVRHCTKCFTCAVCWKRNGKVSQALRGRLRFRQPGDVSINLFLPRMGSNKALVKRTGSRIRLPEFEALLFFFF